MMPISNSSTTTTSKRTSKLLSWLPEQQKKKTTSTTKWWQKLIPITTRNNKKRSIHKSSNLTQNWRNLSPDEPPLPFLIPNNNNNKVINNYSNNNPGSFSVVQPIKFSEADSNTSELAPILKDNDVDIFFPSTSLYISHNERPPSSSRELYTIPELSEMNTTNSNTPVSSIISPITNTEEEQVSQQHQPIITLPSNNLDDLFVVLPQQSSSSIISLSTSISSIPQINYVNNNNNSNSSTQVNEKNITPVIILNDDDQDKIEQVITEHVPIAEWPTQTEEPTTAEPQFDKVLQGNEMECKMIFCNMLESAYKYHQLYKGYQPKEMYIIFDEKDNIGGIKFILPDGTRQDYLQFGGTPQYIPPELSTCSTYNDELADVWALGISLYRMLVGKYPFVDTGVSHMELFKKMFKSDFSIPSTLSPEAKDLMRRMLAPESTRASFDLIMFHPWLKPHVFSSSTTKNNEPDMTTEKLIMTRKKKIIRLIKKVVRLVFLGPYPPLKRTYYYHPSPSSNRNNTTTTTNKKKKEKSKTQ